MRQLLILGLMAGICASGALVSDALAGSQDQSRIALHIQAPATKNACTDSSPVGQDIPCQDFNTGTATVSPGEIFNAYLIVANGEPTAGIAGLSCGIQYDPGALFLAWTVCADLQFVNDGGNGDWPANLGGNRITWTSTTNCQNTVLGADGVHAVAGFFYVYSYGTPGLLEITPNNNVVTPELQVSDCSAQVSNISPLAAGTAGFGTEGFNPCSGVPTQETSWGDLKTRFE